MFKLIKKSLFVVDFYARSLSLYQSVLTFYKQSLVKSPNTHYLQPKPMCVGLYSYVSVKKCL